MREEKVEKRKLARRCMTSEQIKAHKANKHLELVQSLENLLLFDNLTFRQTLKHFGAVASLSAGK